MRAGTNIELRAELKPTTDVDILTELRKHRTLLRIVKTACIQGMENDANPTDFIVGVIEKSGLLQA